MNKDIATTPNYDIAKGKTYFEAKQYSKKGASSWFAKLGQSLVAVVVILPFAGLLAAVGGIIMSLVKNNEGAYTFGLILSDMGQTVLSNLGLLFMLAILLGFTNNKGYAIFSSIVGYIAFVGFITPFIRYHPINIMDSLGNIIGRKNDPSQATSFNIWFWHGLSVKTQLANIFGLGQSALQYNAIELGPHGEFARASYRGFTTLNTGVLGGIVLGFVDVLIYNKGKDLHLPNMLSFFSGEKFSSVVALIVSPVVASLFIIIWPGVNYVLGEIGVGLTYLPYGIDAGVFGIAKQLLIPFEAHQALIAPLWYTAAGGQLSQSQPDVIAAMMYRIYTNGSGTIGLNHIGQEATYIKNVVEPWAQGIKSGNTNLWDWINATFTGANFSGDKLQPIIDSFTNTFSKTSDATFNNHVAQITSSLKDYSALDWTIAGDQLMTMAVLNNNPKVDIRDFWASNLKITRFITGGYANLMFLTPAVGLAIWSTLPKGPRKRKFAFYFGAMMPSFLLGVNEPIIFMFAYTAPLIYYVWYSGVCGILFLFTALFQAKLSSTFSQGLLDYVVNGVIPTVTRTGTGEKQTLLWIPLVIGVITFFLGFTLFRWLFIKNEFMAPGMEEGIANKKAGQSVFGRTKPLVLGFLDFFQGKKNIEKMEWQGKKLIVKPKATFEYKKNDFRDSILNDVIINKNGEVTLTMQKNNDDINRAVTYIQSLISYGTVNKLKAKLRKENELKLEEFTSSINDKKALIKKADKAFKMYLKTKSADPKFDNKEAINKHNAEVKKQLADLNKEVAKYKEQIKLSNENSFSKDDKLNQKLAKIQAKWQLKHDSLDRTNDIEKETALFKENLWALTNQEQRELAAAQGKEVSPISGDTKNKTKELTKEHKQRVKELEAEKKAKIKAERHADRHKEKAIRI